MDQKTSNKTGNWYWNTSNGCIDRVSYFHVLADMEEDALQVMKFMSSNGLCANPKKTALVFLNLKFNSEENIKLRIGNEEVFQVQSAKLLGMTFDNSQKWTEHIYGTGDILSKLNQRLFLSED